MFGIQGDKFLTFIFLVLKYYYVHCCKFSSKTPNIVEFIELAWNVLRTQSIFYQRKIANSHSI